MKFLYLAETACSGDITTCCSDYALATYLHIIKQVLNVIHLVVPIILIIMVAIAFLQMVINPDDPQKKKTKSIKNKFFAAVIIFFIPFIVNLVMSLLPDSLNISGCWNAAEETVGIMNNTEKYNSDLGENNGTISDSTKPSQNGSSSDSSSSNENNKKQSKGKKISNYAKKFVGEKYVYGGSWDGEEPYNPTDCSGFVMGVYKHFGINLPRTASAQSNGGKTVSSLKNAKPGDLLFYSDSNGYISHVTMYIGDNKVVHASSSTTGVKISDVGYRKYSIIKRYV